MDDKIVKCCFFEPEKECTVGNCDVCELAEKHRNELSHTIVPDSVNHPNHYSFGGIECIDAIRDSMGFEEFQGYCKGNLMKYIWRWRHKGGIEDLRKARVYLNWLIDSAEDEAKGAGSYGSP